MSDSLEYFCGNELPASVVDDKYLLRNCQNELVEKSPDDMHHRLAKNLARIEASKFREPYSEEYIFSLLKDFGYIIPQGGSMSGIGSDAYVTLSNCYVIEPPLDSYAGIHFTDEQITQISKRRGGVGTDISHIRPDGASTSNAARSSSGIVPFCERFSNSIREVGQNGRRGALMLTISVHHPQIKDFCKMKMDKKSVTGANVSVRLTDEFMNAVENGEKYELRFPVDSPTPEISEWVDAREMWDTIISCAWERAEPGLLFWDLILSESPADCYAALGFLTISTNPCSELGMCFLDSCRLLLANLFAFVKNPFKKNAYFDFDAFKGISYVAQRLMDDIVDLELECIERIIQKVAEDPEPIEVKDREINLWHKIKDKCEQGRRTGTGPTGLADAIAAVGLRYGSDESIQFVDLVYKTMKLGCYRASVDMAKEIGPFPIWDALLEKNNPFLLRIRQEDPVLYEDMQKYGRRNIALLTTAPAGTTSILAGPRPYFGTSSGIEPLFTDEPYIRRKKITPSIVGARVDFVDDMGDKWTNYPVFHSKLQMWLDTTGDTDYKKSPYHGCCANDLDWKQRVKLQAAAQKHIDHSISSTINVPKNTPKEKIAEIYETAWRSKCKGITVYRDECRDGVLIKNDDGPKKNATKRPKDLPCEIYRLTLNKEPVSVIIGLYEGKPYEVFAFTKEVPKHFDEGKIHKIKRGHYVLKPPVINDGFTLSLATETEEAFSRMVSTLLRHGTELSFVVHQLEKANYGFARAIARALKKFIRDGAAVHGEECENCKASGLVRQEGCVTCRACGWSKCS